MLELDGDGFEIETMMNIRALRAGLRVAEVPSFEAPRIYGESNLRTFPDGWRVLKTIFRERFRAEPLPLAPHGEEPLRPAVAMPIRPAHGLVAVPVEEAGAHGATSRRAPRPARSSRPADRRAPCPPTGPSGSGRRAPRDRHASSHAGAHPRRRPRHPAPLRHRHRAAQADGRRSRAVPSSTTWCSSCGARASRDVWLLTGHGAEVIQTYFGTGDALGVRLRYSVEPVPLGTGGALRHRPPPARW